MQSVDYFGSLSTDCSGEKPLFHAFSRPSVKTWGYQWLCCYRIDLHNELRLLATGPEGKGTPAILHLSSPVTGCDPETGLLHFENGPSRQFDVIVGADGIRSKIRTSVVGHEVVAPIAPTPAAAFRWMMPASALEGDPEVDWVMKEGVQGGRVTTSKDGHFLLCYPCHGKQLINNIAIHLDTRDQNKHASNEPATREQLLEVFKDYAPKYKAWLSKAENIRLWQLRTLPPLPTWVNANTTLIGDACHAMFPMLGQGAAMVLEDATVLAGLLPFGTKPSQVNARLRAYQDLRKLRTEFVAKESQEQTLYPFKRGFYSYSDGFQDFMMHYDAPKVAREYYEKHFAHESSLPAVEYTSDQIPARM